MLKSYMACSSFLGEGDGFEENDVPGIGGSN